MLDAVPPNGFYTRNGAAYYGNDAGRKRCEVFMPDTNIADAWRVVEKMRAKGWLVKIDDSGRDRELTTVWFQYCRDGFTIDAEGVAQSLVGEEPESICLAALRACGVSEDRIEQARRKA